VRRLDLPLPVQCDVVEDEHPVGVQLRLVRPADDDGAVEAALELHDLVAVRVVPEIRDREQTFRRMLEVATATGRHAISGYRRPRDGVRVRVRTDGVITAMRDPSGTLLGLSEISRPVD
jgi:hypothetical protein